MKTSKSPRTIVLLIGLFAMTMVSVMATVCTDVNNKCTSTASPPSCDNGNCWCGTYGDSDCYCQENPPYACVCGFKVA